MRATNRTAAAALRLPASGVTGSAVRQAAHQYVDDGEGLGAFLADLELACQVLNLPPPSRELIKEASIAWVDEFLTKTDPVGCEDPLTGMATTEHARRHLQTLYRVGGTEDRALVVVALLDPEQPPEAGEDVAAAIVQSLRLAMIAETIRASFERCEVVVPLTGGRVLAVVGWDAIVSNRVDELGWLLRRRLPVSSAPRVHLEPLPATEAEACALLDDARRPSADDNGPGHGLTEPAGGDGEVDRTVHLEVEPEVE